jgi:hypothetical protein
MRQLTLISLCCFALLFWYLILHDSGNYGSYQTDDQNKATQTVEKFWRASLEAKVDALVPITTSLPRSFDSACWRETNEPTITPSGASVGDAQPARLEDLPFPIADFASEINLRKYQLGETIKTSINGNEAIAVIAYKNPDIAYENMSLLLYKEKEGWKVFNVAPPSVMELLPEKMYAKKPPCSNEK